MLVRYLLVSTCFVTSVITEEKWKWSDRERARLVNTTCDIQKKNTVFLLPSKPYGCLGLLHCLLNIVRVHWEAQRNSIVSMECVGVGCTGVYVVRFIA